MTKEITFRPISVRKLMTDMKNTIELMIDLAYSAILFKNEEIGREVYQLEEKMDTLTYHVMMNTMLAARGDVDLAKKLVPVITIAHATNKIADAAADIAGIIVHKLSFNEVLTDVICHSSEPIARIVVSKKSQYKNKSIGEIKVRSETGADIIAIRRGNEWIYDPNKDTKIKPGDILIVRGSAPCIHMVNLLLGDGTTAELQECQKIEKKLAIEGADNEEIRNLIDEVETMLFQLKSKSEIMVGLAFYSILYNSEEVAEDVVEMEEIIDELHIEFEKKILTLAKLMKNPLNLLGMLRVGISTETISDACAKIAEIVLRKLELHPFMSFIFTDADETIVKIQVRENSKLENLTVGNKVIQVETGMQIIALKRDGDWIYSPNKNLKIEKDDILIAVGPLEGKKVLEEMSMT
ncbi:MAG: potassium channel family protein [Candidatus Helarchaeota archaeon]